MRFPLRLSVLFVLLSVVSASAQVYESLGEGVTRAFTDEAARENAAPSFALAAAPEISPASSTPVPLEFLKIQGRPAARVAIAEDTDLYGTGEVFGPLRRNGTRIVCWNTDSYAYGARNQSLYQSHPWVLAVRADGTAFGLLADTTYRCLIDLTEGILFAAEGPEFPVVVIEGDSPQQVLTRLAGLIGTMPAPPRWALGYHQCRYSYTPDARLLEVAQTFREYKIPCDVIWWDIDYMDGFRSFTFHPLDFADSRGLNEKLHAIDFRSIAIIDPGIKFESGYDVYETGNEIDAWVRDRHGRPFVGKVWPGPCVFPDYTRKDVREWWGGLYKDWLRSGMDGIWNDMNEPAVFHSEGWTMPKDNFHRADAELGGPGPHDRYHNVYGMLMSQATFEGVAKVRPEKRPFVLTRATYLGGHRWAATWTGDNVASWEHLDTSIAMTLNLGLSGQPFAGPDIGGFCEKGDGDLFARWMGFGALFPFARGHTGKGNIDKEPWAFGGKVEDTSRRALEARYRLLPYLYTVFHEAWTTGLPVWRPLFFADPADPRLRDVDDVWLIGADLVVAANTLPGDDASAPALPHGDWQEITAEIYGNLWHGTLTRNQTIFLSAASIAFFVEFMFARHLFCRYGCALPVGPIVQSTAEPLTALTLLANLDDEGRATGTWYDDAGEGHGYLAGDFGLWRLVVDGEAADLDRLEGDRDWGGAFEAVLVPGD